jgi:hypothetical protein
MALSIAAPTPSSVARAAPPEKPDTGIPAKPGAVDVPIRRVSGDSKPAKAPPVAAPQVVAPVESCVLAAQVAHAKEVAALATKFAGDPITLQEQIRRAKEARLGTAALRSAGCRAPGGR